LIGSADSAATVLTNTRGNVTTIILWALWLVIPLGFFAMLLQQVLLNPISLSAPMAAVHELIERYRVRQ
jgi:4-amino-4-deoxy-L-arabinose transferase-like glycosyltransferase